MMLKRLACLVLALILALSLAACGGKEPFSADLSAFYDSILLEEKADGLSMEQLTGEYLDQFYPGLSEIECKQQLVYVPFITGIGCEVALVEVANADDVEAVKGIFQQRIDSQLNGGALYPATVDAWENNSEIVVRDNYVCLFVGESKDNMVSTFQALP